MPSWPVFSSTTTLMGVERTETPLLSAGLVRMILEPAMLASTLFVPKTSSRLLNRTLLTSRHKYEAPTEVVYIKSFDNHFLDSTAVQHT